MLVYLSVLYAIIAITCVCQCDSIKKLDDDDDDVSVAQRLLSSASPRVSSRQLKPVTDHLCPVCGGRFSEPADLAVHLGKIHNIKSEMLDTDSDQLKLQQLYHREHELHSSPALSVI